MQTDQKNSSNQKENGAEITLSPEQALLIYRLIGLYCFGYPTPVRHMFSNIEVREARRFIDQLPILFR